MSELDLRMASKLQLISKKLVEDHSSDAELAGLLQEELDNESDVGILDQSFCYSNTDLRSNSQEKSDEEFAKSLHENFKIAALLSNKMKSTSQEKSDTELAKILQKQFQQESEIDNPRHNLVYKKSSNKDPTKSLTDPSWELVDPTPDIHVLFIAFDRQFFWNTLGSVTVSWSKRMTVCSGICYLYSNGACSIFLSEPLLKLRPRKDLVETLLHEMIHAHLFVTGNNRDRDGHGPTFQSHMHRINKESGTNVTIHHDFNDEVALYQKYVWQCNGPCQRRPPYFGQVKRSINRAPGPHDSWWTNHQRACGGTYTKIGEPEVYPPKKAASKSKNKENVNNKKTTPDIRTHFPPTTKGHKIGGHPKTATSNSVRTNISPLDKPSTAVSNTTTTANPITIFKKHPTDSGIFKKPSRDSYTNDFLSVRSHWQEKFVNSTNTKRPSSDKEESKQKVQKTGRQSCSSTTVPIDFVVCPNCCKKTLAAELNSHLDICLRDFVDFVDLTDLEDEACTSSSKTQVCPTCHTKVVSEFDLHLEKCLNKIYDDAGVPDASSKSTEFVSCLACGTQIEKDNLRRHLDECMSGIFEENDNNTNKNVACKCPFCSVLVSDDQMEEHINLCIKSSSNDNWMDSFAEDF